MAANLRMQSRLVDFATTSAFRLNYLLSGLAFFAMISGLAISANAQPASFYTDLESGPNSGGENNAGAYVTVYGKGFGAARGSSQVTVGGGPAAAYPVWSDGKITIQLGSAANTGGIVVSTPAGSSNSLPFTVRGGNIYFVSNSGSDSGPGSFPSPWRTLPFGARNLHNGDILYGMNGVSQTTYDGEGWNAALTLRNEWCSGSGYPRALVAYPGASVTVGATASSLYGIRSTDASAGGGQCVGNWVFAGLTLLSSSGSTVIGGGSNWRIAGNEISCPNGDGAGACFETSQATNVKFYGNNVHDTGSANASALYQGVYFSTDSNHLDIGWNSIANVRGCRGLQIHSSPLGGGRADDPTGHNQFDILIHDNLIHDTQCDGIVISTVDPSLGQVSVYRNVVYNAGKGPNNPEGTGTWTCLSVQGHTNSGPAGGGTVDVYANTFFDCGSFATPPYGGASASVMNNGENPSLSLRIRNNIFYQVRSASPYLVMYDPRTGNACADFDGCTGIFGTNNLFYGIGPGPASTAITAPVNSDPLFLNLAGRDFHLQGGSPAADSGTAIPQDTDFDGVAIPRGTGYPIGAYKPAGGIVVAAGVKVAVSPLNVTLRAGQSQSFAASVTGAANNSVVWSVSPPVGAVSFIGVYTAPAVLSSAQTVVVTATSIADGTKAASATINLSLVSGQAPSAISVTPNSGSGAAATLSFLVSDPQGAASVGTVLMMVNASLAFSNSCQFRYNSGNGSFYLYGDSTGWLGPLLPGSAASLDNGLCSVLGAGTSVLLSGTNIVLNVSLRFAAGFAGAKNVYLLAQEGAYGAPSASSDWQLRGTWTAAAGEIAQPLVSQALSAVSVTPNSGSGSSTTLSFLVSDPQGAASIGAVLMMVNAALAFSNSCQFRYNPGNGAFYLYGDSTGWLGPLLPGSAASLDNGLCSILGTGTSVTASGTNIVLNVSMRFVAGFAGAKNVYLLAQEGPYGTPTTTTSWQQRGTWTVGAGASQPTQSLSAVSVTPNSGGGAAVTFSFLVSDSKGAASLGTVLMMVNASLTFSNSCQIRYNPANGAFYLYGVSAGWQGPLLPGAPASLDNGLCSVLGTGTSVIAAGTNIVLNVSMRFGAGFAGVKNVYLLAQEGAYGAPTSTTNWQPRGTWTVNTATGAQQSQTPSAVSVTPGSGAGPNASLSFLVSDPQGASSIGTVLMMVNATLAFNNSCQIAYYPPLGAFALYSDSAGWLGPLLPGSTNTIDNGLCSLSGIGTSVISSGTNMLLSVSLHFAPGFAGLKNVYLLAQEGPYGAPTLTSNWQPRGTWTAQ